MRSRDKSFGNYGHESYDVNCNFCNNNCYSSCSGGGCKRCGQPPVGRCPDCPEMASNCDSNCRYDYNCQKQNCQMKEGNEPCYSCNNCSCSRGLNEKQDLAVNTTQQVCDNCNATKNDSAEGLLTADFNDVNYVKDVTDVSNVSNVTMNNYNDTKDEFRMDNCSCSCTVSVGSCRKDKEQGNCSATDAVTLSNCSCNCSQPEVDPKTGNDRLEKFPVDGSTPFEGSSNQTDSDDLTWDDSTLDNSTFEDSTQDYSLLDNSTLDDAMMDNSTDVDSTPDNGTSDNSTLDNHPTMDTSAVDNSTLEDLMQSNSTLEESIFDDSMGDNSTRDILIQEDSNSTEELTAIGSR